MSKEYNGGKAGFWIGLAVEMIPSVLKLVGGLVGIFRAGRNVEANKQSQALPEQPTDASS